MSNTDLSSAIDRLIELAGHTEIIKHVPGLIELKVKATGIPIALSLKDVRATIKGILGAKGDVPNRTVAINYDEKLLPKELWDLLMKSGASPKIQQLVKKEILSRVSKG